MDRRAILQPQLGPYHSALLHIVRSAGSHVVDGDGRDLLDLNGGYWNVALGYGASGLIEAASEAFRRLSFAHLYRRTHEPAVHLARLLHSLSAPGTCEKVLYSNDGTGAAETALRLVLRWSEYRSLSDPVIVVLKGAYHGDSLVVREIGDYPTGERHVTIPGVRIERVFAPDAGARTGAVKQAVAKLRTVVETESVAAIFAEIIQGVAGVRVIHPAFLREMNRISTTSDALFVLDEIATGIGRTGRMFASEHYDLTPDITLIGKGITGGFFPLGVTLAGKRVRPILRTEFQHGHTTSGHPVGCAIAIKVLTCLAERGTLQAVHTLGSWAQSELRRHLKGIATISGLGLLIGLNVSSTRHASRIRSALQEANILIGQEASVLTIVPPLNIEANEFRQAITQVIDVMRRLSV